MLCCIHKPVQHNGARFYSFSILKRSVVFWQLWISSAPRLPTSHLCLLLAPVLLSVVFLCKCCVVSGELYQVKWYRVHSNRDWASTHSILFQHMLHMTASLILSLIASSQRDAPGCRCCLKFCPLLFLSYETVALQTHILLLMAAIKKLNTISRDSLHHLDRCSNHDIIYSCVPHPPTLKVLAWISERLGDRPIINLSPARSRSCCEENLHIVWDVFGQLSWM